MPLSPAFGRLLSRSTQSSQRERKDAKNYVNEGRSVVRSQVCRISRSSLSQFATVCPCANPSMSSVPIRCSSRPFLLFLCALCVNALFSFHRPTGSHSTHIGQQ